jgi:hypothetical protein
MSTLVYVGCVRTASEAYRQSSNSRSMELASISRVLLRVSHKSSTSSSGDAEIFFALAASLNAVLFYRPHGRRRSIVCSYLFSSSFPFSSFTFIFILSTIIFAHFEYTRIGWWSWRRRYAVKFSFRFIFIFNLSAIIFAHFEYTRIGWWSWRRRYAVKDSDSFSFSFTFISIYIFILSAIIFVHFEYIRIGW